MLFESIIGSKRRISMRLYDFTKVWEQLLLCGIVIGSVTVAPIDTTAKERVIEIRVVCTKKRLADLIAKLAENSISVNIY